MWHIIERCEIDGETFWKFVSFGGYTSFEEANKTMRNDYYNGETPQDHRFAIVLVPLT